MIKIKIIKKSAIINTIEIKGHANYTEYGNDIVCASVSSIIATSINAILSIDPNAIEYIDKNGYVLIKRITNNEIAIKLLNNLVTLVTELANSYPKNINIRNEDE